MIAAEIRKKTFYSGGSSVLEYLYYHHRNPLLEVIQLQSLKNLNTYLKSCDEFKDQHMMHLVASDLYLCLCLCLFVSVSSQITVAYTWAH